MEAVSCIGGFIRMELTFYGILRYNTNQNGLPYFEGKWGWGLSFFVRQGDFSINLGFFEAGGDSYGLF